MNKTIRNLAKMGAERRKGSEMTTFPCTRR